MNVIYKCDKIESKGEDLPLIEVARLHDKCTVSKNLRKKDVIYIFKNRFFRCQRTIPKLENPVIIRISNHQQHAEIFLKFIYIEITI